MKIEEGTNEIVGPVRYLCSLYAADYDVATSGKAIFLGVEQCEYLEIVITEETGRQHLCSCHYCVGEHGIQARGTKERNRISA
jgi:hypothetical protein